MKEKAITGEVIIVFTEHPDVRNTADSLYGREI